MVILINPNCAYGTGARRWRSVEPELRKMCSDFRVVEIGSPDTLLQQLKQMVSSGETAFIAAGGDGTVNLLLNAVMTACSDPASVTIGAVGLGSSNDFHKPFRPERMVAGVPVRIDFRGARLCDLIRVEYARGPGQTAVRYCLTGASAGITAEANALFNSRARFIRLLRGVSVDAAIIAAALKIIVSRPRLQCKLTIDESDIGELSINNLGVVKNPHFAGTLCYDTPIEPDDGKLRVNLCFDMTLRETIAVLIALARRLFLFSPKTRSWLAERVALEGAESFALEMDGEVVEADRVRFSVVPQAVRCCC